MEVLRGRLTFSLRARSPIGVRLRSATRVLTYGRAAQQTSGLSPSPPNPSSPLQTGQRSSSKQGLDLSLAYNPHGASYKPPGRLQAPPLQAHLAPHSTPCLFLTSWGLCTGCSSAQNIFPHLQGCLHLMQRALPQGASQTTRPPPCSAPALSQ